MKTEAQKRYEKKIKVIKFDLNIAQSKEVEHIENLNKKAKEIFLKNINEISKIIKPYLECEQKICNVQTYLDCVNCEIEIKKQAEIMKAMKK